VHRLLAGLLAVSVLVACSLLDCGWDVAVYADNYEASSELQYACRF
jgi:hypothetical protein